MKLTVVPSPSPAQEKGEKCGLNKAQNPAISAIGIFLMNLRFQRCTPCSDKTTYSTKKVTKRSSWIPGKSELSPTTSSKYTLRNNRTQSQKKTRIQDPSENKWRLAHPIATAPLVWTAVDLIHQLDKCFGITWTQTRSRRDFDDGNIKANLEKCVYACFQTANG